MKPKNKAQNKAQYEVAEEEPPFDVDEPVITEVMLKTPPKAAQDKEKG